MKQFKHRYLFTFFLMCLFSTQVFSMGAMAPKTSTSQTNQTSKIGKVLPLIETLLPLLGGVSPLAQTALPLINNVLPLFGSFKSLLKPKAIPTMDQVPTPQDSASSSNSSLAEQIKDMVIGSNCSDAQAPIGYVKGVALSFARNICRLSSISQSTSMNFDIIRASFVNGMNQTINTGLGSNCAGAVPTNFNSMSAIPELLKLFTEYKTSNKARCFLQTFQEGSNCQAGNGNGADASSLAQSCPAFAVEYAMTLIKSKLANNIDTSGQTNPACDQLLQSVQDLIVGDLESACKNL